MGRTAGAQRTALQQVPAIQDAEPIRILQMRDAIREPTRAGVVPQSRAEQRLVFLCDRSDRPVARRPRPTARSNAAIWLEARALSDLGDKGRAWTIQVLPTLTAVPVPASKGRADDPYAPCALWHPSPTRSSLLIGVIGSSIDEAQSTNGLGAIGQIGWRAAARRRGRRTKWIRQVDGRSAQKAVIG